MVLEAEVSVGTQLEIRPLASQTPDNLSCGTINLVDGACVSRRDEIVSLAIFVDRVDVEVVPCVRGVVAGSSLSRVDGKDSLYEKNEPDTLMLLVLLGVRVVVPSGETCSRLDHSKSSSPVVMSSSKMVSGIPFYFTRNFTAP